MDNQGALWAVDAASRARRRLGAFDALSSTGTHGVRLPKDVYDADTARDRRTRKAYVVDIASGRRTRIDVDGRERPLAARPPGADCPCRHSASASATGDVVALVAVTRRGFEIFARDVRRGRTTVVSQVGSRHTYFAKDPPDVRVSSDGRFVAFVSTRDPRTGRRLSGAQVWRVRLPRGYVDDGHG